MRTSLSGLLVALTLTANAFAIGVQATEREHYLGRVVENFQLDEPLSGSHWSLVDDNRAAQATVLYFVGTECPVNNLYVPILNDIKTRFAKRGVVFVAIDSDAYETPEKIASYARDFAIALPVLRDAGSLIARRLGAKRTTEAILLDGERKIRYRGRIDDRFERGKLRPRTSAHYLVDAIEQVLAGTTVTVDITDVTGCPIAFSDQPTQPPKVAAEITYTRDVAPIMQTRCQTCHQPGEIGPFSLMTYRSAAKRATSIREVITTGLMPPWHAAGERGHFSNDRRLTASEYATLLDWIDAGCVEGDQTDLPPAIKRTNKWHIAKQDMILKMAVPFTVPAAIPEDGVPYKYFWAGDVFAEERWVQAAEVMPGERRVVHHVIAYVATPAFLATLTPEQRLADELTNPSTVRLSSLVSFVPGDQTTELPKGFAKHIPAGSRLFLEMHYTPIGRTAIDQTSIALQFATEPPTHIVRGGAALNFMFAIPPHAKAHKVTARRRVRSDIVLLSMNPHMHYRGRSYTYELIHPDKSSEVLLAVPRYDFNWQSTYTLATPVKIKKGSIIKCTAIFDNSATNPFNPDPTAKVTWGDQTWEEMMLGYFEFYRQ